MRVAANSFDRLWAECGPQVLNAIDAVGTSGWYVLGTAVAEFEQNLAQYCGTSRAVGVGNGMDALEISLRAANIGPGDQVLTTPLSAFATGLAILRAGAEPVYADVDAYGLLSPAAVVVALEKFPAIKAIMPVHLYGHLADTRALATLATQYGAVLIEDAAQAIGASRGGVRMGQHGLAACLSFYPTKNLGTIGDGGALITSNAKIADLAGSLRNYGQTERYVHNEMGMNSRLDEVHAAILKDALLPRLDTWTARRREIAHLYMSQINSTPVEVPGSPDPEGSVWHLFPVLVAPARRGAFMAHLADAGIQAGQHYPILIPHQKAITSQGTPHLADDLTTAKRFADSEVSLPIQPYLEDDEVAHVIATVNAWAG